MVAARAEGSREYGAVCGTLVLPEAKNSRGRFPKVNYRLESGCDGKFYALHIFYREADTHIYCKVPCPEVLLHCI